MKNNTHDEGVSMCMCVYGKKGGNDTIKTKQI